MTASATARVGSIVPPGSDAERETGLAREGWTRRFTAAPPRLEEAVELYESLGYEVRLEPPSPDELREECEGCPLTPALFRVIYTRRRA